MFSTLLKSFRALLLPFAVLYWLVIWLRNRMYDKKILPSASFGLPVICVGNLSVGGTGKSPMVEYLVRELKDRFRVSTLSRGYKRRTKGFALAGDNTTALDIGDEPMQFHLKFPDIPVAVGEERMVAIPQLLHERPETQAIILDDAFQHRAVKAGLNILLTDCNNLFTKDFYLPAGRLRDLKSSYKRAHVIIVTKCRAELSKEEATAIEKEIQPLEHQHLFFTSIQYGEPYHILSSREYKLDKKTELLLVAGIANPLPLKRMLEEKGRLNYTSHFPDHHIFTIDDLKDIKKRFEKIDSPQKIIVTTEKDAMRLIKFREVLHDLPIYVIPIRHQFLFDKAGAFNGIVVNFIENFKREV